MQPLRSIRRCLPFILLAALFLLPSAPASAQDATVAGTLNYVSGAPGAEIYRYDYTLTNVGIEPTVQTFILFFDSDTLTQAFDGSEDCDFHSATGPTADWEVTPFEPTDPDAWYVEFTNFNTLGPAPGEEVATFSVEILWKNPDTVPPTGLFYEAMNGWAHEGVTQTSVETTAPRNSVVAGHVYVCCCQTHYYSGTAPGAVTPQCWGGHAGYHCDCTPQTGVTVDLYRGDVLVASMLTNSGGEYSFSVPPGGYTVNIVTPLGYYIKNEVPNVGEGQFLDFFLGCVTIENRPQTVCYWKHQSNTILYGGCGKPQVSKTSFIAYLDLIYNHFTLNPIHPVVIYQVPPTALAVTKLNAAQDLLTVGGCANIADRARQELMALLLNVAGLKIKQTAVISWDGAQVNQAITHAGDLISAGGQANVYRAWQICATINGGTRVRSGWIPLETPVILYDLPGVDEPAVSPVVTALQLGQNYPNPFNPTTRIPFSVPSGGINTPVRLEIFDMSGRLVRTLVDDARDGGEYVVSWDGTDDAGNPAASGIYFYSMTAGGHQETRKLHLLK